MPEKRGVKKVKQDWCFASLADARQFMDSPPDNRFKLWSVTDPVRPGEVWYVCERTPLGAIARAADRWGVEAKQLTTSVDDPNVVADIVKQMAPAARAAFYASLGVTPPEAPGKRRK